MRERELLLCEHQPLPWTAESEYIVPMVVRVLDEVEV